MVLDGDGEGFTSIQSDSGFGGVEVDGEGMVDLGVGDRWDSRVSMRARCDAIALMPSTRGLRWAWMDVFGEGGGDAAGGWADLQEHGFGVEFCAGWVEVVVFEFSISAARFSSCALSFSEEGSTGEPRGVHDGGLGRVTTP